MYTSFFTAHHAIKSTNQLLRPTHFKLFLPYRLKICNYVSASEPAITPFLVAIKATAWFNILSLPSKLLYMELQVDG